MCACEFVPWLPPACVPARLRRARAAAPMYAQLPQIQVTQEMQHLKEQVGQIDQLLRTQHPQQTLNQLNAKRVQLMAQLQSIARQQQGAQMMQYPPGTPQQSISQAMQWMQPHASQRVPRRQMADMKEVQHRALAKLHMAPAAVPDQLGPEGAAAVQRRRALLEAHDELERNNTWMQELLSPCDTTAEQDPAKTWEAIRERLTAWQVPPSHTLPPFPPRSDLLASPPRARAPASSAQARGEQLQAEQQAQHERLRTGIEQARWRPAPPAPPTPSPSRPPSPPCLGACRLSDLSRARVREVQDARRFNEALGALKQASSLKVRPPACGGSASAH